MHDSFMPLGDLVLIWMMQLGEIIYGGVGSGLYGMLAFVGMVVLIGTAVALMTDAGIATILNPSAHGFSEVLYAFSSAGNNNGSAIAGLGTNPPFYNSALGIAMFIARYWLAIPMLAIAGSLSSKKKVPATAGTLPTHTPLFVVWLIGVIVCAHDGLHHYQKWFLGINFVKGT